MDLGSDGNAVAYAWAAIQSDVDRPVQLLVGSDDSMLLWLNGKQVHQDLSDSGWNAEEATVNATLNKGRNLLLVKVGNHGGGWQFSVAVSGERKGKLYARAVSAYETALRLGVDDAEEVFSNMGVLYSEMRRGGDAARMYQRALEIRPDYVPALFNLAGLLEEQGDRERAIELYRQILSLDPGHSEALSRVL